MPTAHRFRKLHTDVASAPCAGRDHHRQIWPCPGRAHGLERLHRGETGQRNRTLGNKHFSVHMEKVDGGGESWSATAAVRLIARGAIPAFVQPTTEYSAFRDAESQRVTERERERERERPSRR